MLWLFTDARRLADPCPAIGRLPKGLAGVVFRHDRVPGRAALASRIAGLCRARRIALVIAGDPSLAARLGAGFHLREPRSPPEVRRRGLLTASAHDRATLLRAARFPVDLVFLSPAFATKSHPGRAGLGACRWNALARRSPVPVAALGGITGETIRRLPEAAAAGAIGALD